MTDGFGSITWWGFSPALNLLDSNPDLVISLEDVHLDAANDTKDALNILLVGSGDLRHVLKTIAQSYRHHCKHLHFYVLENNLELYARDLLFLTIALEPPNRMGLQEKTELFLELYGNILIRQQSCDYVQTMATEFIKMVTDFDYLEQKLPLVDLSQLKFKERDFLEGIFKFWRNPDVKVFEVWKYWDLRVRQYLKTRYDSKFNAFDWDYHINLMERGDHVDIIHKHEYNSWRDKGVAFEIREGTYDVPNKTLASGLLIKHEGENYARRGYWGDIIVSPYITLAIQTEYHSVYEKRNGVYVQTAQNVAELNVLSMFHEIATREPYVPPVPEETTGEKNEQKGPKLTEITEEDEEAADLKNDENCEKEIKETEETVTDAKPLTQDYESLPLDGVKVTFLPLNCLQDLPKKSKYKSLFDIAYFSNSMVHLFTPETSTLFQDKANIVFETAKFMLELKADQAKEFTQKITGMAEAAGCKASQPCDGSKDAFARFTFTRNYSS